jgi:hypothetical protein
MPNPTGKGGFKERKHQINRDGRPADAVSLAALVRRIGHEVATTKDGKPVIGPDGKPMTVIETILRQRAQDKKYQSEFIDRGWGKVATPVDMGGTVKHEHKHDLSRLNDVELEQLDGLVAKLTGDQG